MSLICFCVFLQAYGFVVFSCLFFDFCSFKLFVLVLIGFHIVGALFVLMCCLISFIVF